MSENLFGDLSTDELMTTFIDAEWEERQRRKIANLVKRAAFKQAASASDIDYHPQRGLDKTTVQRLLSLGFRVLLAYDNGFDGGLFTGEFHWDPA
jgi:DNA replication protein DnaC